MTLAPILFCFAMILIMTKFNIPGNKTHMELQACVLSVIDMVEIYHESLTSMKE
jgi:hypothetical protein